MYLSALIKCIDDNGAVNIVYIMKRSVGSYNNAAPVIQFNVAVVAAEIENNICIAAVPALSIETSESNIAHTVGLDVDDNIGAVVIVQNVSEPAVVNIIIGVYLVNSSIDNNNIFAGNGTAVCVAESFGYSLERIDTALGKGCLIAESLTVSGDISEICADVNYFTVNQSTDSNSIYVAVNFHYLSLGLAVFLVSDNVSVAFNTAFRIKAENNVICGACAYAELGISREIFKAVNIAEIIIRAVLICEMLGNICVEKVKVCNIVCADIALNVISCVDRSTVNSKISESIKSFKKAFCRVASVDYIGIVADLRVIRRAFNSLVIIGRSFTFSRLCSSIACAFDT